MANETEREAGTIIKRVGPVAIMCMAPDARDALDLACAEYEKFKGITHDELIDRGIYQCAYWLFRYSGLVEPTALALGPAATPAEQEAEA